MKAKIPTKSKAKKATKTTKESTPFPFPKKNTKKEMALSFFKYMNPEMSKINLKMSWKKFKKQLKTEINNLKGEKGYEF